MTDQLPYSINVSDLPVELLDDLRVDLSEPDSDSSALAKAARTRLRRLVESAECGIRPVGVSEAWGVLRNLDRLGVEIGTSVKDAIVSLEAVRCTLPEGHHEWEFTTDVPGGKWCCNSSKDAPIHTVHHQYGEKP